MALELVGKGSADLLRHNGNMFGTPAHKTVLHKNSTGAGAYEDIRKVRRFHQDHLWLYLAHMCD